MKSNNNYSHLCLHTVEHYIDSVLHKRAIMESSTDQQVSKKIQSIRMNKFDQIQNNIIVYSSNTYL